MSNKKIKIYPIRYINLEELKELVNVEYGSQVVVKIDNALRDCEVNLLETVTQDILISMSDSYKVMNYIDEYFGSEILDMAVEQIF